MQKKISNIYGSYFRTVYPHKWRFRHTDTTQHKMTADKRLRLRLGMACHSSDSPTSCLPTITTTIIILTTTTATSSATITITTTKSVGQLWLHWFWPGALNCAELLEAEVQGVHSIVSCNEMFYNTKTDTKTPVGSFGRSLILAFLSLRS